MVRSRFIHVSFLLACCTLMITVIAGSSVSLIAAPAQPQVSLSQAQTYDLHITAGTTINWFNADSVPHRLRAVDGSWETPVIAPGEQINQPFTTAGLSAFLCDFDPAMRGTLVVQSTHAVFVPLVANITTERRSDPVTWGGRVPQTGDAVTIPAGKVALLDVSPPPLQSLLIEGELRFDRQNLDLTVG